VGEETRLSLYNIYQQDKLEVHMGDEVVVIGAGYAGLTAAAILSKNDVEVEVLEATGHPGGRAAFDRKDGFLVDYGIHVNRFGAQGAAAAALREVGHEIDFVSMGEPRYWRNGKFMDLPTGVPQFLKAEFLSAGDKAVMIGNLLRLVLTSSRKNADVPLKESMWGLTRPEIQSTLKVLSGLGLVAPDIAIASTGAFSAFLKNALRAKEASTYPRGGTSQIIETLLKSIEENGKVSFNSRVKSIEINGGMVTEVKVKEEALAAKAFIFAVPLQRLPELTEGGISDAFADKCNSIIPTAGISVDLCLSNKISEVDGIILTGEPMTMGQFTSNIDPSTAPEGKQLVTWYYPLPVEMMDDHDKVEVEQRRLIELLEKMFPGLIDNVEWERMLRLKMVDGYEPRIGQTEKDRPGIKVPGVENLFLAGDVVSAPGNGGDVAFASAVEAAHAVLAYLK
jgi:phytoene desaturase